MRLQFDDQLLELNKALITMGAICEISIAREAEALLHGNREGE